MDRSLIVHPSSRRSTEAPMVRLERWLVTDPQGAEPFRVICARLRQLVGQGERHPGVVLAVTSAKEAEGKTLSSINLAATLARDYLKRVLLLEADLWKPTLSRRQPSLPGLVDCAKGEIPFEEAIVSSEIPNLHVLVGGHVEGDPSTHFLGAPLLRQGLVRLRERYDYVVVDCPPLLPTADMGLVAEWADHLLLVIRAGVTDRSVVTRALETGYRERVLGVILNGVSAFGEGYGGYPS